MSSLKQPSKGKNTHRNLSMKELKARILDWQSMKPVVVDSAQLTALVDRTVIKRFAEGDRLLGDVTKTLERLAAEAETKGTKKQLNLAIEKIESALGAMKWGPHYANSAWRVPPPVLWHRPKR